MRTRATARSVLPGILEALTEPALFWLDAHPGTDRTARDAPIPLRAELAAIAGHPVGGHVVLIDDIQYLARRVTQHLPRSPFPATGSQKPAVLQCSRRSLELG